MTSPSSEMDEFFRRVARAAPALRALGDEVGATRRHESTDPTGTIRVTLDKDGMPEVIELPDDWQRRIGAEGFAAAVTAACRGALEDRGRDFEAFVERTGWSDRLLAITRYIDDDGPEPAEVTGYPPDRPVPVSIPDYTRLVGSRAFDELMAELADATNALSDLDEVLAAARTSTGTAAQGRLSLILDGRLVRCEADPDWVSRRDPEELRAALATALAEMRAAHAAAEATRHKLLSRPEEIARKVRNL